MSWLFCDRPFGSLKLLCTAVLPSQNREQKQYSLENQAQSAFQLCWELAALKTTKRIITVEITESRLNVLHRRGGMAQVYPHGASTINVHVLSVVSHLPRILVLNVFEPHLKQSTCTSFKKIKVYREPWM